MSDQEQTPLSGFYKLDQIIGNKKLGIPGLIPMGKSTWWRWVEKSIAPEQVKFENMTFWRKEEIHTLIDRINEEKKDAA